MDYLLQIVSAWLLALGVWWGGDVSPPGPEPITAEVIEVIDGDTIDVLIGGERERIRYIGIDTPEFDYETGVAECFASEAKARNEELLAGGTVGLLADVRERDDYNRLLRYVYVGEESVGEQLVAEGYARAVYIKPDVAHYSMLKEAENEARAKGAGLWSACR